jgi:hypothetical protein
MESKCCYTVINWLLDASYNFQEIISNSKISNKFLLLKIDSVISFLTDQIKVFNEF